MNRTLTALGLVSALALAACGGTDNTTTTIDNMGMASPLPMDNADMGDMGNGMATAAVSAGQAFANTVAASDAYEIEAGKLAQQKATTQALKDFGKMMVDGHSTTTEKLKALAANTDPKITPDPALTAEQQANLQTLRDATGADFDAAYKAQQVAAHTKALAALKDYAASGDVAQFKTFAGETAPVVKMHLDKIKGM
ncbi:MAG: DUF4142 domain-containing protein [Sphingomonadales bacterium]|nr:MAG: DUF4142 domain-containing protein [Sphingomonadales bacterium]